MIHHYTYNKAEVSSYQKPKAGNEECGDSFFLKETDQYFICALADGLGSGSLAKEASQAAMDIIEKFHHEDITDLMVKCNDALRQTRGSVLTIVKIDFEQHTISYCGVGNIRFMLAPSAGKVVHPLPTLGFLAGKPQAFKIQQFGFENTVSFMLYSDGMDIHTQSRSILSRMISPKDSAYYISNLPQNVADDATCLVGHVNIS